MTMTVRESKKNVIFEIRFAVIISAPECTNILGNLANLCVFYESKYHGYVSKFWLLSQL